MQLGIRGPDVLRIMGRSTPAHGGFTVKRGHVAVLALALALAGCGGSDDDGGKAAGASSPPAPAATSPSPPATSSGKGKAAAPTPPAQSKATKAFNACMRKQGVELPSPNPTRTPALKDLEKIKAALQTCVKSMSASPTPR
jgi:hypothetical protein